MDVRQLIKPGMTASALAHLLLLGSIVLYNEVHPFGVVTAEPIAVDLVPADDILKKPDEKEQKDEQPPLQLPKDDDAIPAQAAASAPAPAASAPQASPSASPVPRATQQPAVRTDRREAAAAAQPQPAPSTPAVAASAPQPQLPPPPPPQQPPQQQPAYKPPEPDLTVKYGVMLGLPEALPSPSSAGDKPGDGIDANASTEANLSSSLIEKFRAHLRTCSKLPPSVARSDNVFVKLRVKLTLQGKMAAEPVLIEGTASMKGLDLKESAVRALSACQPYDMLPADRYGEWKVLDLPFKPQDFS
jgi:hypothetical protein